MRIIPEMLLSQAVIRTVTPEMILKIIRDKDEAGIYEILAQRGVDAARDAYEKAFGFSVTDKRIDEEIEGHFFDNLDGDRRRYVPARILLALLLREGGAGRGRGQPKSDERRFYHARAKHQYAKQRKAGKSQDEAIEIVRKSFKISAEALRDGRVNRKRPNRKKAKA